MSHIKRSSKSERYYDDELEDRHSLRKDNDNWYCSYCNESNYPSRSKCYHCGERKRDDTVKKKEPHQQQSEIGKDVASRYGGLFSEKDWSCPSCFNINWSKRLYCNICRKAKPGSVAALESQRTGRGGGYNEREEEQKSEMSHYKNDNKSSNKSNVHSSSSSSRKEMYVNKDMDDSNYYDKKEKDRKSDSRHREERKRDENENIEYDDFGRIKRKRDDSSTSKEKDKDKDKFSNSNGHYKKSSLCPSDGNDNEGIMDEWKRNKDHEIDNKPCNLRNLDTDYHNESKPWKNKMVDSHLIEEKLKSTHDQKILKSVPRNYNENDEKNENGSNDIIEKVDLMNDSKCHQKETSEDDVDDDNDNDNDIENVEASESSRWNVWKF